VCSRLGRLGTIIMALLLRRTALFFAIVL